MKDIRTAHAQWRRRPQFLEACLKGSVWGYLVQGQKWAAVNLGCFFILAVLRLYAFNQVLDLSFFYSFTSIVVVSSIFRSFEFGRLEIFRSRIRATDLAPERVGLLRTELRRSGKVAMISTSTLAVVLYYRDLLVLPYKNVIVLSLYVLVIRNFLEILLLPIQSAIFAFKRPALPGLGFIAADFMAVGLIWLLIPSLGPWSVLASILFHSIADLSLRYVYLVKELKSHQMFFGLRTFFGKKDARLRGAIGDQFADIKCGLIVFIGRWFDLLPLYVIKYFDKSLPSYSILLALPFLMWAETPGRRLFFDLRKYSELFFEDVIGKSYLKWLGAIVGLAMGMSGVYCLAVWGIFFLEGDTQFFGFLKDAWPILVLVPTKAAVSVTSYFLADRYFKGLVHRDQDWGRKAHCGAQFASLVKMNMTSITVYKLRLSFRKGVSIPRILKDRALELAGPNGFVFFKSSRHWEVLVQKTLEVSKIDWFLHLSGFLKGVTALSPEEYLKSRAHELNEANVKVGDVQGIRRGIGENPVSDLKKRGALLTESGKLVGVFKDGKLTGFIAASSQEASHISLK